VGKSVCVCVRRRVSGWMCVRTYACVRAYVCVYNSVSASMYVCAYVCT